MDIIKFNNAESEQPDGDSVGRYQYYNRCILPPIYRVLRSFMPERNSQPGILQCHNMTQYL